MHMETHAGTSSKSGRVQGEDKGTWWDLCGEQWSKETISKGTQENSPCPERPSLLKRDILSFLIYSIQSKSCGKQFNLLK